MNDLFAFPYGEEIDAIGERLRIGEDARSSRDNERMGFAPFSTPERDAGRKQRLQHVGIIQFERHCESNDMKSIQTRAGLERISRERFLAEASFTDAILPRVQTRVEDMSRKV